MTFFVADDFALNSNSEHIMQETVNTLPNACHSSGLSIGTTKIEVLHRPAPCKPYSDPDIKVNGERLKAVDTFTYI